MFYSYSRNFYNRLFLANYNKVSSRALFSNWHNSTGIFGQQFAKIQKENGFQQHWNKPFRNQEFCQRSQFCTGNNDISSPVDDNDANSSSPISSLTEIPASIEQKVKQEEIRALNHQFLRLSSNFYQNTIDLNLSLKKGKSGQKFFRIDIFFNAMKTSFPNIPVPQDAYIFVRKMDELIWELATGNYDQQFVIHDNGIRRKTVEFIGCTHKYQLELLFFPNIMGKKIIQKQLCLFQIRANNRLAGYNNKWNWLYLPLGALPDLRERMADMLIRHDGTEMIEMEAPAKIPEQFL